MTSTANAPTPQTAAPAPGDRMPRGVRRAIWGVLAGVVALGVYLITVRGPAILVDLATGVANAFCF